MKETGKKMEGKKGGNSEKRGGGDDGQRGEEVMKRCAFKEGR